jgi:septum site-determining protein MinC
MALVLAPEPPLQDWMTGLDDQMRRSPSFFAGRPVVVDLSGLAGHSTSHPSLIEDLQARDIRIIGVEGADETWSEAEVWGRTPMLSTGRADRLLEVAEETPPEPPPPPSLLIDRPVRSGQSVVFERGDVIVVGSVASGAEVIAGGSVHVYGALRGRAVAGLAGRAPARIFCTKLQAELLSIDGIYRTADDMDPALRGRTVQAWLDCDVLQMAALN